MPLQLAAEEARPIAFAEFVRYLDSDVDFRAPEGLVAAAPMLRRLAANRRFLSDWAVDALLGDPARFQQDNFYNYQSLVLAVTDSYLVRANFWAPEAGLSRLSEHERQAFGYGVAHNHNFHLLTIGYSGAGYDTDVYRMRDPERVHELGEIADLERLGVWHLGEGDVMFYEAFADVHVQLAPPELSVSLNVMTHSTRDAMPQYVFDTATGRITSLVASPLDARIDVALLARHVLPDAADSALRAIARNDPSPRLRLIAARALERS